MLNLTRIKKGVFQIDVNGVKIQKMRLNQKELGALKERLTASKIEHQIFD